MFMKMNTWKLVIVLDEHCEGLANTRNYVSTFLSFLICDHLILIRSDKVNDSGLQLLRGIQQPKKHTPAKECTVNKRFDGPSSSLAKISIFEEMPP